jgi:hypothetical protein
MVYIDERRDGLDMIYERHCMKQETQFPDDIIYITREGQFGNATDLIIAKVSDFDTVDSDGGDLLQYAVGNSKNIHQWAMRVLNKKYGGAVPTGCLDGSVKVIGRTRLKRRQVMLGGLLDGWSEVAASNKQLSKQAKKRTKAHAGGGK